MKEEIIKEKVKELINKAYKAMNNDPDKCIELSKQALEISQKISFAIGEGMALMHIGLGYYHKSNYTISLNYYSKSLKIFEKNKFSYGMEATFGNIGNIYSRKGEFEKALEYFLKQLKMTDETSDKRSIALAYNNIGNVMLELGNYIKALANFEESLKISEEIGFEYNISNCLNNIAIIYKEQGKLKKALDNFLRSVEIKIKSGDNEGLIYNYIGVGKIYKELEDYEKALEYYQKSFKVSEKIKNKNGISNSLISIADIYRIKKDYNKALECLNKSKKLALEENMKSMIQEIYFLYSKINSDLRKYKNALVYHQKYSHIKDKIFNEESSKKIAEMQTKYETEKKEKEAEIYRLKNIELQEKNKQIEKQKIELQETIDKLHQSEIKYDFVAKELNRSIGTTLIGESEAIRNIIELISTVAQSDKTNVLITGESGTGKEIIARNIHQYSKRKKKHFYAVNSSAVPESLFESHFFGYEKNAFTGANSTHIGWFEIADKGTLFLDEIGTMSIEQQAKLLRVLEENKIVRVGSHKEINVDVRIISATNINLLEKVRENKFRNDLYYRLATFVINIPPLRERKEDIPLLLRYFVEMFSSVLNKKIKRIENQIDSALINYDFPGNVRELKNMVERAILISDSSTLKLKHFVIPKSDSEFDSFEDIIPLEEMERKLVLKALKAIGFNKRQAAKLLKVNRRVVERRMKKYGIKV